MSQRKKSPHEASKHQLLSLRKKKKKTPLGKKKKKEKDIKRRWTCSTKHRWNGQLALKQTRLTGFFFLRVRDGSRLSPAVCGDSLQKKRRLLQRERDPQKREIVPAGTSRRHRRSVPSITTTPFIMCWEKQEVAHGSLQRQAPRRAVRRQPFVLTCFDGAMDAANLKVAMLFIFFVGERGDHLSLYGIRMNTTKVFFVLFCFGNLVLSTSLLKLRLQSPSR